MDENTACYTVVMQMQNSDNFMNDSYVEPIVNKQKAFLLIILLLVLGLLIYLPFRYSNKNLNVNSADYQNSVQANLNSYSPILTANDDPDGDGIPNWQEQLYGTNPKVSDRQNIPTGASAGVSNTENITSSTNLTDTIGRDLYLGSSYISDSNGKMDPNVMGAALAQNVQSIITPNKIDSVNVADKNDLKTNKNYLNSAGIIFLVILSSRNQFKTVNDYIDKKGDLSNLVKIAPEFTKACESFKIKVQVPNKYYSLHKDLAFECDQNANIMQSFSVLDQDPLRALAAIGLYEKNIDATLNTLKQYSTLVKSDGIIFNSNENGYIFNLTNK